MRPLAGKLALVTGASRGIGAATALQLGTAGAHVIMVARTSAGLEAVEEDIHAAGGTATIAPLDLLDDESVSKLALAVSARWQALDFLILNAATLGSLSPLIHSQRREWDGVFALNVTAQLSLLTAFDQLLRKSNDTQIIGLTTSIARVPRAYFGAYGASKAAFENILLSYAEEMRNIGRIRVALVDPGATRTAMRAKAMPGEDPLSIKPAAEVAQAIAGLVQQDYATGHYAHVDQMHK